MLLDAAKLYIPIKRSSPISLMTFYSSYQDSFRIVQKYRSSRTYKGFLEYQKLRFSTTTVFRKVNKHSWTRFCPSIKPSTSLANFWLVVKTFNN